MPVPSVRHPVVRPLVLVVCASLSASAFAADAAPVQFEWNLRARTEHVDDAAFARNADAGTLRLRAGLRGRWGAHWSGLLEAEAIGQFADDYNSGANGRTPYPAVTDPTGVELNQAWLAWQGGKSLVRAGRQRLNLDNQRWLGASGWRQNEQTFDAIAWEWAFAPHWTLRYDGLARVHRVAGDDARDRLARERELRSHFINVSRVGDRQQWTGYAYLHEDRDVATASTATWGLRWHGDTANAAHRWGATLELAHQADYADNPRDFSHTYWLVEPSFAFGPTTLRAGWEHLGGDGTHALQTPLATLHAFNGWADRFLVTPAAGLEDRYLAAGRKFGQGAHKDRFGWQLAWHDYRSDEGSTHYGNEWNASFAFPIARGVDGLVKFADYRHDDVGADTTKVWLQVEWVGKRP